MNDIFRKDKIIWETEIRNTGKKYELFTEMILPKYKIKFIDNLENIRYSMQVLNSTTPMTLNVNMGFMLSKSFDYKSTAFHEFTHMCDYTYLLTDKDDKYKKTALSLFSEFHATYIQSLCLLGLSSIHNSKNVLLCVDKLKTEILKYIDLINKNIQQFEKSRKLIYWDSLLKAYMYYYGSIIAYNQNVKQSKMDIISFDFKYNKEMTFFYQILCLNKISEDTLEISYKLKTLLNKAVTVEIIKSRS